MISVLLAILAGAAALWNFGSLQSSPLAILTLIVSILAIVSYRGKRSRKSYQMDGTRIFTLSFAICFVSLIGNLSVAVAIILHLN